MTKSKSKFKIKYSKTSIIIRIILSLFLVTAIFLVVAFRVPISRKIYKWDATFEGEADFSVHFIDVGQGDASLIEFDDGKNMLIDCGPKSAAGRLVEYIQNLGINTIDYFLVTHADADHIGGGVKIFQSFEIKNFYRPMMRSYSETEPSEYPLQPNAKAGNTYDDFINVSYGEEGVKMFYTDSSTKIEGENYTVNVLYPDGVYKDTNATSAVLQANLNGKKFLFTGDAGISEEMKMISKYAATLKTDVLKVGHHGSSTSTSDAFLSYVEPDFAVISVGAKNPYGHPHEEVINRLNTFNIATFTTAELGSIVFETQNGQIYTSVGRGKMIDYALIAGILGFILLLVWGIPDFGHKSSQKKVVKK